MSSVPRPAVSVVIPTLGQREREAWLRRAVASVLDQRGVRAVPLVVLNGAQPSPAVECWLRAEPRLRLVTREEANLPLALLAGRRAVDTPFFATLDDDDQLLPDALALRRELIANGFVMT